MLSDDFPVITQKYHGKKSQASAMEHAIRWQIKERLDSDPEFYERFKDRLDAIMKRYDGNWEQMIKEYEQLKAEMDNGREPDPRFKPVQAPFYGSLKSKVNVELTDDVDASLVRETKNICSDIKSAITIANFWDKPSEVQKLRDKIASRIRLGLRGAIATSADAAQEIMGICRSNYCNILRKLDDLA